MTANVYAVAGGKGGVGKTTTAVNLAGALGSTSRRVVLVDADLAMSNLSAKVGVDREPTLHDVLSGEASVREALAKAAIDVGERRAVVDVLVGSDDIDAFARADPADLEVVVATLSAVYDVVLLDVGSGVSRDVAVPLEIADEILLVTTPAPTAVSDAENTVEFVDRIGGTFAGAVVARTEAGLDEDEIVDRLGMPCLAATPDLSTAEDGGAAAFRRIADALEVDAAVAESGFEFAGG